MAADTKTMLRVGLPTLLVLVLVAGCTGTSSERPTGEASPGSPEVDAGAIERHADSFDDVPERAPGSQQEFAAATYITGHLQQAGYTVRLDAVPVQNLVRSTNVVALPPSGEEPTFVVVVDYGGTTSSDDRVDGLGVGTFLEIARTMAARSADHSFEFIALGAQEDALGSKRLARFLLDAGSKPEVLQIFVSDTGGELITGGPRADEFYRLGCPRCLRGDTRSYLTPDREDPSDPTVPLTEAGFEVSLIAGDPVRVGETLVEFLEGQAL